MDSGLATSARQDQQRVLGCNRDIVAVPSGRGLTTRRWSQVVMRNRHITGCARALGAGHVPVRAALTNGLSRDEFKEILLQTAIYCASRPPNTAFKTAQQVFREMDTTP
jgi:phytoene dehydrogenase-like protein